MRREYLQFSGLVGIVLVGANRHDVSQLGAVLDSKIVHQTKTSKAVAENLCADAGYVGETADAIIRKPSSESMATSHTCVHAAKRSRPRRTSASSHAAGLSKCHTAGSTTSASSRSAMKRQQQTASPCITSPPQPSRFAAAAAKKAEILFTDRF